MLDVHLRAELVRRIKDILTNLSAHSLEQVEEIPFPVNRSFRSLFSYLFQQRTLAMDLFTTFEYRSAVEYSFSTTPRGSNTFT